MAIAVVALAALSTVPAGLPAAVVLLDNGSLFEGTVSARQNHVLIVSPQGDRLQLPRSTVAFVGHSPHAAFRYQLGQLAPGDGPGHRRLVHWCIRNGLQAEGRTVLNRLRMLDPKGTDLGVLEKLLAQPPPPSLARLGAADRPPIPTAAPVSRRVLSQFARHVQPILVNRCASARCHGRSRPKGLELRHTGTLAHEPRHLTLANLQSVLTQVDLDNPQQSQLVVQAQRAHGGLAKPPLRGLQAQAAGHALLGWISLAAKDQRVRTSQTGGLDKSPAGSDDSLEALNPEAFNALREESERTSASARPVDEPELPRSVIPGPGASTAPPSARDAQPSIFNPPGSSNSPASQASRNW